MTNSIIVDQFYMIFYDGGLISDRVRERERTMYLHCDRHKQSYEYRLVFSFFFSNFKQREKSSLSTIRVSYAVVFKVTFERKGGQEQREVVFMIVSSVAYFFAPDPVRRNVAQFQIFVKTCLNDEVLGRSSLANMEHFWRRCSYSLSENVDKPLLNFSLHTFS